MWCLAPNSKRAEHARRSEEGVPLRQFHHSTPLLLWLCCCIRRGNCRAEADSSHSLSGFPCCYGRHEHPCRLAAGHCRVCCSMVGDCHRLVLVVWRYLGAQFLPSLRRHAAHSPLLNGVRDLLRMLLLALCKGVAFLFIAGTDHIFCSVSRQRVDFHRGW